LCFGSFVSEIVLVVLNTGVLFLLGIIIEDPIVVAVTETGTVKTSSLTAVVVSLAGKISFVGITILSSLPAAISPTVGGDGCGCGGECAGCREGRSVGCCSRR